MAIRKHYMDNTMVSGSRFVVKTSQGFLTRTAEQSSRLRIGERNYAVSFGPQLSRAIYFGKKENAETVAELAAKGNPDLSKEQLTVLSFDEAVQHLVEFYRNLKAE